MGPAGPCGAGTRQRLLGKRTCSPPSCRAMRHRDTLPFAWGNGRVATFYQSVVRGRLLPSPSCQAAAGGELLHPLPHGRGEVPAADRLSLPCPTAAGYRNIMLHRHSRATTRGNSPTASAWHREYPAICRTERLFPAAQYGCAHDMPQEGPEAGNNNLNRIAADSRPPQRKA